MMPELPQKKKKEPSPSSVKAPLRPFNQDIELITNGRQSGFSNFGLQPSARSAMDYQPPDSFIQNLDRPTASIRPFPSSAQGQGNTQQKIKGNILADLWA
jgi:hypothetical protein